MIVCTQFQMMYALVGPDEVVRIAGGVELGPFTVQYVHGCLDGQVTVTFLFGQMIGPFTSRLFRWMHEEGACDESLATKDWIGFFARVIDGTESPSELARGNAAIAAFVATRTKDELLAAALERNLLIAPITTTSDVLALGQLRHREYWEDVEGVRFPGSIAKLSGSPLHVLGRPPRLGEHTDEVRAEPRRTPSAPPAADPPPAGRPLDGVKVLDFMWAFAGPYATRMLADYGATVVKIETSHKVDVLRVVAPWNDPSQSVESALQYHSLNAGKLGLALDLSKPGARDVVLDLVRWADVVTESFSPKAMRAWDLGYDALRAVNPDLVMLSSCLMGQTGPMHRYAGFGTMAAAVAGFYPGVGWPDRPPCGPFTAYTDYTSPRFAVAVLLAALEWRRRTGEGQFIDFSQMEACLHLLAPELLDDAVNGRVAGRDGNRDRSRHRTVRIRPRATIGGSPSLSRRTSNGERCARLPRCLPISPSSTRPPACHARTSSTPCSRPGPRDTTPRSCRRRCSRRACRRTKCRTPASASPTRNSCTVDSSARFRTPWSARRGWKAARSGSGARPAIRRGGDRCSGSTCPRCSRTSSATTTNGSPS